jgi:hypothetical protein
VAGLTKKVEERLAKLAGGGPDQCQGSHRNWTEWEERAGKGHGETTKAQWKKCSGK